MKATRKLNNTSVPEFAGDKVSQVKEFLYMNYEIKMNVFDTKHLFIEPKYENDLIFSPSPDDIYLHLESEGIHGCRSILNTILASPNQITIFNPIEEYFIALEGKWKGVSEIEKFCSYLTVRDFGDKEKNHYHNRLIKILKKWMAASIACSLGEVKNDAVFGLIHSKEGIGKSTIMQFLTPNPLKDYYHVVNDKDQKLNVSHIFTSNFIVNFDDNVGLTKSNATTIKAALSADEFKIGGQYTQKKHRIANCVLTSNKTAEEGGFLFPDLSTRRWALVEIEDINLDYYNEIDIDQMWAEAYVLYKNTAYSHIWDLHDFADFNQYNQRYIIETEAKKLIREYFRKPNAEDTEDNVLHLQAIDIIKELRAARKLTSSMTSVNVVTIGQALSQLGYNKTSSRQGGGSPRYRYEVVKNF